MYFKNIKKLKDRKVKIKLEFEVKVLVHSATYKLG